VVPAAGAGAVWQAGGGAVEFREMRRRSRGRREEPQGRLEEKSRDGLAMSCGGGGPVYGGLCKPACDGSEARGGCVRARASGQPSGTPHARREREGARARGAWPGSTRPAPWAQCTGNDGRGGGSTAAPGPPR
jgi:hypothetical protein